MKIKEKELIVKLIEYCMAYGETAEFRHWLDIPEDTEQVDIWLSSISTLLKWEVYQKQNPFEDLQGKIIMLDHLLGEAVSVIGAIDAIVNNDDEQDCWRETKDLRGAINVVFGMALSIRARVK